MKMLSSFLGEMLDFCLITQFKHVGSCPSFIHAHVKTYINMSISIYSYTYIHICAYMQYLKNAISLGYIITCMHLQHIFVMYIFIVLHLIQFLIIQTHAANGPSNN